MHPSTDARTSRLVRPLALVAALAALGLALTVIARPALAVGSYEVPLHDAHQGADSTDQGWEDEDCGPYQTGVVWHFILNQYPHDGDTAHLQAWFANAGSLETDAVNINQSVQHFYVNTPGDDVLDDAVAFVNFDEPDANLILSHICHTGSEETPSPSQSASEEPSQPASEAPSEEATPTPEESEQGATSTPTPTPEGSVLAGTGTPAPSLPDSAVGAAGGPSPLPTVFFGLILLASLTTLAWVNVKAVRSRA